MSNEHTNQPPVVLLAGATGNLGGRIGKALIERRATVRALVRPGTDPTALAELRSAGLQPVEAAYDDPDALDTACAGADVVVSAISGARPVIVDAQTQLLRAAERTHVARFVPSDYCVDYRAIPPSTNRNLELRREFARRADVSEVRVTSILNGAFADQFAGSGSPIVPAARAVLYLSDPDQVLDFTTMDDTAAFTAAAALDPAAPRVLEIAGDRMSARGIAAMMTELTGRRFRALYVGGVPFVRLLARVVRAVTPASDAAYPVYQMLQYLDSMFSGDAELRHVDDHRYGTRPWTTMRDVLATAAS